MSSPASPNHDREGFAAYSMQILHERKILHDREARRRGKVPYLAAFDHAKPRFLG
jgi:hypothetical protein